MCDNFHFLNVKKFREIDLFDFTSFLEHFYNKAKDEAETRNNNKKKLCVYSRLYIQLFFKSHTFWPRLHNLLVKEVATFLESSRLGVRQYTELLSRTVTSSLVCFYPYRVALGLSIWPNFLSLLL